jgi:hypothetical protein
MVSKVRTLEICQERQYISLITKGTNIYIYIYILSFLILEEIKSQLFLLTTQLTALHFDPFLFISFSFVVATFKEPHNY